MVHSSDYKAPTFEFTNSQFITTFRMSTSQLQYRNSTVSTIGSKPLVTTADPVDTEHAPADGRRSGAMSCTVRLLVRAPDTQWGETLCVVGDATALGTWGVGTPVALASGAFPAWSGTVVLPAHSRFEYKYVVVADGVIRRWEQLGTRANRAFTTGAPDSVLAIDDGALGDGTCVTSECSEVETEGSGAGTEVEGESTVVMDDSGRVDDVVGDEVGDEVDDAVDDAPGDAVVDAHAELAAVLRKELEQSCAGVEHVREQLRTIRTFACEPVHMAPEDTSLPATDIEADLQPEKLSEAEMWSTVQSYMNDAAIRVDEMRADLDNMRSSDTMRERCT